MKNVLIIGGGPAGMMAAIAARENGAQVTIFEKNEKLGKKLYITGKGRCNLTNACDKDELFKNVNSNKKFLYSAFNEFDNVSVMDFFESHGLKLKTERGKRVFPESDKSSDVIKTLKAVLEKLNVNVSLNAEVTDIKKDKEKFIVTVKKDGHALCETGDALIIATGGVSYPLTGSTGDGYKFAKKFNHNIVLPLPSLVPIETNEDVHGLAGLSLKNVKLSLVNEKGKSLYSEIGEMLFTHTGISGPLVLSASAYISDLKQKNKNIPDVIIDLKPGMTDTELDSRILKDFSAELNRNFSNSLNMLLPQSLIPYVVALSKIDPEKKVNAVTKEERESLRSLIKNLCFTVKDLGKQEEAIITKGGVGVKEINPSTMESKNEKGLYFAGEVLDVDAMTGGFNLQIAWSTGRLAGEAASESV